MMITLMNYKRKGEDMADKRKKNNNGEGSFRQQCRKWNYRFSYKDEYEVSRVKSVTAETKEECLEKALAFLEKLEKKKAGYNVDATITDILSDKYQRNYEKNHTGEAGYRRNLELLKLINKYPISSIPIAEITPNQIELFLQAITVYADNTIKKIHQQVKSAFTIAKEQGIITKNLMALHDFRKPNSRKNKKIVKGFTLSEQMKFEKALAEYKVRENRNDYKLQLLIELYSGLRMGEINALKPEDIDFNLGVIHVRRTVSVTLDGQSTIKYGAKTEKGMREVPICSTLKGYLEEALDNMTENPDNLIFYNHYAGKIIPTGHVNAFFKRVLESAGMETRGQHSLRHTFATRCIESGVPAVVLKEWLGHTDIHITLDTYADVFTGLQNDSINKYETYLDNLNK